MRLLRAGLVAGVFLTVGGIGLYFALRLLLPESMSGTFGNVRVTPRLLGVNVGVRLLMGCALIWLYAAARFRLRSTARTAFRIGVAAWLVSYVPLAWTLNALQLLPRTVILAIAVWGFAEMVAATLAGGLVHRLTKPQDARY